MGWRNSLIRKRNIKQDWVEEISPILFDDYPDVPKNYLICDNPNKHTIGALDAIFPP